MKRGELEHVLRAAGAITGVSTWVIVGQAILGAVPNAPEDLLVSQEVDLYGIVSAGEIRQWLEELEPEIANRIEPQLRGLLLSSADGKSI
jgi:hypothetical protein